MIEFIFNEGPMGRGAPAHRILYRDGRPTVLTEYADSLKEWTSRLRTEAALVMRNAKQERPLVGHISVDFLHCFKRPEAHYSTNGSVKKQFASSRPTKYPILPHCDAAVVYALEGVVIDNKTQVVTCLSNRIWTKEPKVIIRVYLVVEIPRTPDNPEQQLELSLP